MSKLEMIVKQRRLDVAEAKTRVAAEALRARVAAAAPPNDFAAVLSKSGPMALLAEMKRASPSKGDIAPHTDAAQQGLTYALAGACTISVLTEPSWFKGSLDDLARVRAALVAGGLGEEVCVLRKDFIVDEYQLLEARAHGADTALLIVAALSAAELSSLMAFSRSLGMEPLVEAANEGEMRVALDAGARVIGVNNRNLHTFEVDMTTTSRCAALVPSGSSVRLLALSGVATRSDVTALADVGACGVLVGESLMRADSPAGLARELLGLPPPRALCKVCGVRDAETAAAAAKAGADLIGVILAPSKRQVSVGEAAAIVAAVREARPRPKGWALPRFPQRAAPAPDQGADEARETRQWLQGWSGLLRRACAQAGPLVVGLHGNEGWAVAAELARPAVRVVHMGPALTAEQVCSQIQGGLAAAVLLDSKGGGTGKTFDWSIGEEVQRRTPFILAGGLTPDNVGAAVRQVGPWCVDVSSGIETDGVKDPDKIEAYLRNAAQA
ncbi:hypothetical protein EMIHUDRAFT_245556 [Emiliania huxleyi CCMP1516]|uniref:Indole-3-glycerol phosphate synthase n=2 Tax=Emiliania huxleyi TaxID=2903 RepID=A0A0D3IVX8_EMIH1|nr:hypothetical protein EMIHUDRAFT_211619 [Emiliania huxleyi CCMP1516]XP_005768265.1 hypothetical protein EMIHUDRAFT_245556 [Emiliania huxleyi CCMP1516]EOD15413.1 hypothetical protein EMIHUDRAFT_211619 [Emiliania huxleyi CCMP1516]EOD15836.1 hypothetical protein EMIHUDRAFT_245556 [Emiliania huxleyi CCMP1516]|eukprot:XP_005767842.1 hypothetical protein EMIHUDRAFT_211619 [Emiliania huxleyi CCMP1516]